MESLITLNNNFEAVFLVNGIFTEKNTFSYDEESVIYITVLPMDSLLLPYTIKFSAGKILNGKTFATSIKIANGFLIKLHPRFSYVYSTQPHLSPADIAESFFEKIKNDDVEKARAMLCKELSLSLTDTDLKEFFAGYTDIIKATEGYYLINTSNEGELYEFSIKNELIENIFSLNPQE